jgi:hypothetical protein
MTKHDLQDELQRIQFTSNIYMEVVWPIPVIPAQEIAQGMRISLRGRK